MRPPELVPGSSASFPPRSERLSALENTPFDVLVIGGGITGAAMARDATTRGLKVALLEREDWASGTSSRSSKLIHGGLRYLKTGDFHLIFESLSERARLLELAPHLVCPLDFLLPSYAGRGVSPWLREMGLSLYDLLALGRSPRSHRRLSKEDLLRRERLLESPDLLSGALYADARTDDARLTLENALDAVSLGAVAASRIEVRDLKKDGSGKIAGVTARDLESGRDLDIPARVVINATGPWADSVRRRDDADAPAELRLSKGVHLTIPADRLLLRHPVTFPLRDGRLLFAIPYGPVTLVGTTDTEFAGSPDNVVAERGDIQYLLDAANETFPSARLTESDIVATFAGLRPLLAETGKSTQDTSREDAVTVSPAGLVTVTGGKLTTHRLMGEKAIDRVSAVLRKEGRPVPESATRRRPFPGAPRKDFSSFLADYVREAGTLGMDGEVARHLARRYGRRAEEVLALAAEEKALSERLLPRLPDIAAEIVFAARAEDARTLADVLIRRTHLFWQAREGGMEALDRTAELLSHELGWDRARVRQEREEYERKVAESRRCLQPRVV